MLRRKEQRKLTNDATPVESQSARSAEDVIFSLNREPLARRLTGERVVNATLGAILTDDNRLAVLSTASRTLQEVPPEEWAAYAPIAGTPEFLKAVTHDVLAPFLNSKRSRRR